LGKISCLLHPECSFITGSLWQRTSFDPKGSGQNILFCEFVRIFTLSSSTINKT